MIDGYNKPTYIYGGYLTVPSILKNKREMPDCTRINILIARRKKKRHVLCWRFTEGYKMKQTVLSSYLSVIIIVPVWITSGSNETYEFDERN